MKEPEIPWASETARKQQIRVIREHHTALERSIRTASGSDLADPFQVRGDVNKDVRDKNNRSVLGCGSNSGFCFGVERYRTGQVATAPCSDCSVTLFHVGVVSKRFSSQGAFL